MAKRISPERCFGSGSMSMTTIMTMGIMSIRMMSNTGTSIVAIPIQLRVEFRGQWRPRHMNTGILMNALRRTIRGAA